MEQTAELRRPKVSQEAAEAIKKIIVDNELQPGDKLPSQAELSRILQVGTRSIREAIKTLEARGIVVTHQGKGIYLKETDLSYFMEILGDSYIFNPTQSRKLLLELTYVRRIVESNVIYDLAKRPNKKILQKLIEILENMEHAVDSELIEEYSHLDVRFHKTIIGSVDNEILVSLYKYLSNMLNVSVANTIAIKGSLQDGFLDHRKMVEALVARDPNLAREIMNQHINKTQEKLEKMS
jgi:GntR family transcriptional regulator, transcriptional repressor for pyruvate dehydrogenase complex